MGTLKTKTYSSLTVAFALSALTSAAILLPGCNVTDSTQIKAGHTRIGVEIPPEDAVSDAPSIPVPADFSADERLSYTLPDETTSAQAVCDPFGKSSNAGLLNGLEAKLFSAENGKHQFKKASDYLRYGKMADVDLFFNQLYVPTRPFDQGFMTQDGSLLKTENGDTLYEYFGLHFESEIGLAPNDKPGMYQIAVLSDDGALLRYLEKSGFKTLVDNDGDHPTQMGCAKHVIELNENTRIPIDLDYYQGPRYHISLVMLWRLVEPGESLKDPSCGKQGNALFFDSTKIPPAPQPEFQNLLKRGWKVMNPENFFLPGAVKTNPCSGLCFKDRFPRPLHGSKGFRPSHRNLNPDTLSVTIAGKEFRFDYDKKGHLIRIPDLEDSDSEIHIGYCIEPQPEPTPTAEPEPTPTAEPEPTPTAEPEPTPTAEPEPTPTAEPEPTPTAEPEPTPSPTPCTDFSCEDGGLIGV
ncbi:MAG: hypothetical protein A2603_11850 [Bdellovibrionales bacterium RIFOXYD1_FULL_55_31]|nr:MAG: hypothetical protein A2603_11850 [Bdellovibrionales bacterium RIFOXYD1_FULL_55_31]